MTPTVAPSTGDQLLTAEEYLALPDRGVPTELVLGKVVEMNVPAPRHGEICANIVELLAPHARSAGIGRLVSNDSGVRTRRAPDTVRGADVAFYGFSRLPRGPIQQGYIDVAPEIVFEVRSPTDRWSLINEKISEYWSAGVIVVVIVDQVSETVLVHRNEEIVIKLEGDDELHLPDLLGDLRIPVRRFFE